MGGGESGVGTAILGKNKGYDVFVSDYGKIKENYKEVLINNGIAWEEEKHTEELILNADVVMKSPGIPEKKSAIVIKLIEKGISEEQLNQIHSPIGLELKAETPEEIAVSIMAEITLLRNGGSGKHMKA